MNIPDVPLPPWARKIQQMWLAQVFALPLLIGFGGSVLIQGCLAGGVDNIQRACVIGALSNTFVSFLTVILSGHSSGSASFHDDGSVNAVVAEVAAITKPMALAGIAPATSDGASRSRNA